ncbi:transposase [Escherichia coli]|nr:transposase [Escherichia coli]
MDEKKLKALATELAKGLKTEADLNQFSCMLTKPTVETAPNAELTDHPGHENNAAKRGHNHRNGNRSKTVLVTEVGTKKKKNKERKKKI